MANPLKILTHLTASKLAKFNEGLDVNSQKITNVADGTVSTDAVAYGQLTGLSSSMKSYVDAADTALQGNLDSVSGALKTYVDDAQTAVQGNLDAVSSSLKTYVDAADTVLQGNLDSVSGAIKSYVDAADTALQGNLDSVSSSMKSYVDAADQALQSNLDSVSGALKTYVDARETVLQGNIDAASSSLSSSIDAEASARAAEDLTFLKLDGSRSMTGDLNMGSNDIVSAGSGTFGGDVTVNGNLQVNGALTYVNTTNLDVTDKVVTIAKGAANGAAADGAGIEVDGAGVSFTYDNASSKWVSDIGLSVAGEAAFDGAMKLSGSAFVNIGTAIVGGKYDVNTAIRDLDAAVGQQATDISSKYDALRCVVTGTLTSGTKTINLSTEGGAMFATTEIDNIALDVMIDADNTGYTNDLVAIKMFVDAGALKVQIDAPAEASAKYRLIAVNEKDGGLA